MIMENVQTCEKPQHDNLQTKNMCAESTIYTYKYAYELQYAELNKLIEIHDMLNVVYLQS